MAGTKILTKDDTDETGHRAVWSPLPVPAEEQASSENEGRS